MTIIAHLRPYSVPTLLGDLLVSAGSRPAKEIDIPASRNINERIFLPSNYYVAGLRQKLVLLNAKLAIAWSGDFMQAVDFFSTVDPLRHLNDIDPQQVQSVIDGIDEYRKNKINLIAMVGTSGNCTLICHRISPPQDFGTISSVACAGSGSQEFLEILKQHAENIEPLNAGIRIDELASGFDLNLISALSGEEFVSTLPLQRGWGGGFEIVRLLGGEIQRVRNQLFLNFFVEHQGDEGALWWVPNFRHLDYWQNLTVIQAIEHEVDSSGSFMRGRNDVFIVGPPSSESVDMSTFSRPGIDQHDAVLTYILLGDRRDSASAVTYAAAYAKPVFRYHVSGALMNVSFDRMFIDNLIDGLGDMLQKKIVFRGARNRPE